MNSSMSIKEIGFVVKNLSIKTISDLDIFIGEFYQTFKENVIPIVLSFKVLYSSSCTV